MDHLTSRLTNGEQVIGVDDEVPNVTLIMVEVVLDWAYDIVCNCIKGLLFLKTLYNKKAKTLVKQCEVVNMIYKNLQNMGKDDNPE